MKQFLLLLPILISFTATAQVEWLKRAGGSSTDLANGLWADKEGNAFVCGSISGSAKFHKAPIHSRGGGDIYVAKYSTAGDVLWVSTFGGKLDDFATAISADAQGNLFITGVFTDTAYFEKQVLISGGVDVFVAKLNPAGKLEWAKALKTAGTAVPSAISVTEQGSAYVGGMFSGNFDNDRVKLNQGQTDGFLCKIDWKGERAWTRTFGSTGFDELKVLKTDVLGRVLVGAVFDNVLLVEENEFEGKSSRSSAAILFEATGNALWTKIFSGTDAECSITDAVTDAEGTCYLSGKFSGETSFGEVKANSNGQTDAFVAALDKSGNVRWLSCLGGDQPDDALVLEILPDGKSLVMAGQFSKLVSHGKKTLTADFDNQFFMARWDNRGNLDELRKIPFHSAFTCEGRRINSEGKLFLSGSFTGKAEFGKNQLISAGEDDIFLGVLFDSRILD